MIVTIRNDRLTLAADTLGAQMQSITSYKGTEYLWNGDERYWKGRAPVLFPFVARLKDKTYTVNGSTYQMKIHGFASACEFEVAEQTESRVTFVLRDNEVTRAQYPFAFLFKVRYALKENTVEVTYTVDNPEDEMLHFGLGGHPGFNVPLKEGTSFEDYYLRFSQPCEPDRVGFSSEILVSGTDKRYELEDGQIIRLRHDLFDHDAIVLKNMAKSVTIASDKTKRYVTVSYPQMPYVGFWHAERKDAPYVCVEPWVSLPARDGVIEDFACKGDLIHLPGHGSYENTWYITIGEE